LFTVLAAHVSFTQWSRFSGGSGAPYWTLIACGLDPHHFTATHATLLHSEYPTASDATPESFPAMIWSTNYQRLASQTLFTFFFGGRDYSPKAIIDGQNIQDYLQSHFVAAFGQLADRIRDAGDLLDSCVIGWDSINEPSEGLLGFEDLNIIPEHQTMKKGTCPTVAQSLRLGMGTKQTLEHWTFSAMGPKRDGSVVVDPKGIRLWIDTATAGEVDGKSEKWGWTRSPEWKLGECIWAQHGVWDVESGNVLVPDYFARPPFDPTRPVVFIADYWLPHFRKYGTRIRATHPEAILFFQPPVFVPPPTLSDDDLKGRGCYSPHYYDGLTLVTRHWNWFNADALGMLRGKYSNVLQALRIGESAIRKSIQDQLGMFKKDVVDILGGEYPTLIGEIGTPFDMDNKRSYGYTDDEKYEGDYTRQTKALDASLNAGDGPNGLSWTVWTYCPDNSHEWGDAWNLEDLSIWSPDDLRRRRMRSGYEPDPESSLTVNQGSNAQLLRHMTRTQSDGSLPVPLPLPPQIAQKAPHVPPLFMTNANGAPHWDPKVNASTASLSTITTVSSTSEQSTYPPRTRQRAPPSYALDEVPENYHDFLTNGARAVGAFARPWPTAVVGIPKDIKFDIHKAEFKLVVTVRKQDDPLLYMSDEQPTPKPESGKTEVKLPTEIYVPFVHFASGKSMHSRRSSADTPEEGVPVTVGRYCDLGGDDGRSSNATRISAPNGDVVDYVRTRSDTFASEQHPASVSTLIAPGSNQIVDMLSEVEMDIEVEVSEGRWEIEGQVLKWWYSVPEQEKDAEFEIEEERWIRIRRKGGPIKGTDGSGFQYSGKLVLEGERLCPCPREIPGCVLM
jgi:hypothetical protein